MGIFDNTAQQNQGQQTQQSPQTQQNTGQSVFDRVGTAPPRRGGTYISPGSYPILFINALKMIKNRSGVDLFIAELFVIASETDAVPMGAKVSWAPSFAHDPTPTDVRTFLAQVMGAPLDDVDSQACQYACSAENPCHGKLIKCVATNVVTKSGNDFTKCEWYTIGADLQSQSAELLAKAGVDLSSQQ